MVDFIGRRQQVAALVRLLSTPDRSGVVVSAVEGMGGVGKTALAVRVGHLVGDQFPDGQLYLNLRGFGPGEPMPAIEALGLLLRSLGVPAGQVPTDVEEAAGRYRSALAGRRVLVVLDNAADSGQVTPLLPGAPECAALVTSRRHLTGLACAHHMRLDVPPEPEAVDMLAAIAGPDRVGAEPQAALAVVRHCGRLPLAIRLAGTRLATRPTWPVAHLVSRLSDEQRRLDGVRASFAVSTKQLDPPTAEAFVLLSLPDSPDISVPAATALLDLPRPDTEGILERLVDLHLVDEPAPARYHLHDLVRLYARERSGTEAAAAGVRRLFDWYLATAWRASQLLYSPLTPVERPATGGLRLTTPADATGWYHQEQENLLALVRQLSRPPYPVGALVLDLTDALFLYFESAGCRADVLDLGRLAMAVATDSGDRRALAQASVRLSAASLRAKRYSEGIRAADQSLRLYRELGDEDGQSRAVNNLGLLYNWDGDPDRAAGCFEQALAIRRRRHDRRAEAMLLGNLGLAHVARGAAEPAITCNQQALAIYRQLGDRRAEGVVLLNLGEALALAGRAAEAVGFLQRSLPLLREFSHQIGEAEALYRLGLAHRDLGEHRRACGCWREAAALYDRLGALEAEQVRALLTASGTESGVP